MQSLGKKLSTISQNLTTAVNNYDSNIQNALSSWTGNTKNTFTSNCSAQISKSNTCTKKIEEFGKFIINASNSIEQLEDNLSNLNI